MSAHQPVMNYLAQLLGYQPQVVVQQLTAEQT
jgi:hypothetical protein